MLVAIVQAV